MTFSLTLTYNSRTFTFGVEAIPAPKELSKSHERFKLTGGDKVVILQSNRPLLMARGLKKVPITWKVIEGAIKYPRALEQVTEMIEKHLKGGLKALPAPPNTDLSARTIFKGSKPDKS